MQALRLFIFTTIISSVGVLQASQDTYKLETTSFHALQSKLEHHLQAEILYQQAQQQQKWTFISEVKAMIYQSYILERIGYKDLAYLELSKQWRKLADFPNTELVDIRIILNNRLAELEDDQWIAYPASYSPPSEISENKIMN